MPFINFILTAILAYFIQFALTFGDLMLFFQNFKLAFLPQQLIATVLCYFA